MSEQVTTFGAAEARVDECARRQLHCMDQLQDLNLKRMQRLLRERFHPRAALLALDDIGDADGPYLVPVELRDANGSVPLDDENLTGHEAADTLSDCTATIQPSALTVWGIGVCGDDNRQPWAV